MEASSTESAQRLPYNPSLLYVCVKLIPLAAFFPMALLKVSGGPLIIVTAILTLAEFWFIKKVSGMQIIGISWDVSLSNDNMPQFRQDRRPDSFLPSQSSSTIFWLGFVVSFVIWLAFSLVFLFIRGIAPFVAAITSAFCESFNFLMFMKAFQAEKVEAEHKVLSLLDGTSFEYVKDGGNQQSEEESAAKEEEEKQ